MVAIIAGEAKRPSHRTKPLDPTRPYGQNAGLMLRSVNSRERLQQLSRLLFSPQRKSSIVVVTSSNVKGSRNGPVLPIPPLQDAVAPFAKVYWLTGGMVSNFNQIMTDTHGIRPSGIRVYLPGLHLGENGAKHRLWTEQAIASQYEDAEAFHHAVRAMFQSYEPPLSQRRREVLAAERPKMVSRPATVERKRRRAVLKLRPSQDYSANTREE